MPRRQREQLRDREIRNALSLDREVGKGGGNECWVTVVKEFMAIRVSRLDGTGSQGAFCGLAQIALQYYAGSPGDDGETRQEKSHTGSEDPSGCAGMHTLCRQTDRHLCVGCVDAAPPAPLTRSGVISTRL